MLILIFFFLASYLLVLNAEFIAIIILIVYIGGICVLFLSAIFILNYRNMYKITEKKYLKLIALSILYICIFITNFLVFPSINDNIINSNIFFFKNNFLPYAFLTYIINNPIIIYMLTILLFLGVIFVILIASHNKLLKKAN